MGMIILSSPFFSLKENTMTDIKTILFSDLHLEIKVNETFLVSDESREWKSFIEKNDFKYHNDMTLIDLLVGPIWTEIPDDTDLILLAGDITKGNRLGDYVRIVHEITGCPVYAVPGNHEYYHSIGFNPMREDMISQKGDNWGVLDRDEVILKIKDQNIRLLGTTLWSDFNILGDQEQGMRNVEMRMNDFHAIPNFKPEDALIEHYKSRLWLETKFDEEFDGQTIVMTHHAPVQDCLNPKYKGDVLNPGFASHIPELVEDSNAIAWAYGHVHWNPEKTIVVKNTPLITNQVGYSRENVKNQNPLWLI